MQVRRAGSGADLFDCELGHGFLGCAGTASSVSAGGVTARHERTNFDGLLLHVVRLGRCQCSNTVSGGGAAKTHHVGRLDLR